MTTVTDPVCGMQIDPEKAAGSTTYQGQTHSFCSRGCKTAFDASPGNYVAGSTARTEAPSGSCCSTARS